jgi:hydrogenase nickel incorporation protein HypA/HybF
MRVVHEFSIAEALATQVVTYAPAGARLRGVEIRVGALRGIDTEALQMAWEAVTFGTSMAGVTLEVDQRPWSITCSECGREWTSPVPFVSCICGNQTPTPMGGDELDLLAVTVDDETDDRNDEEST